MSNNTELNVAIIGLGNIGHILATNLTKGNRSVILADRNEVKARQIAQELGELAQPSTIPTAIDQADIIILAIWFNAIQEFLQQYATELAGKIIVDPSNPIAPDEKGGFVKIIDEAQSAGQLNASLLPRDAKLAKALGTLGAASLASASGQTPDPAVLFYATDDRSIDAAIDELLVDAGFAPLRVGGLDQSIRLEVFGDLHEFGALGKTVTLSEAQEKL
ncbi:MULTISPECIES: NAD(P)-binding domain-containing protein [unclassified Spirosoma]|uniref:NADPH-dependent F420 reductase n=1 Tax=unclassified Spirosoma TaxID=2621999 RepID=UPI0009603318|nr:MULTISPECIES: NAD(P)-binding domain-containing protein [unclassified Spirosoma]MBN8826009.1 NAD(P)-binding domain-containing protein [Spirosoma sp.]OJW71036.1 MAG: NADP oxidoreductase coenzyme F420-dependent [Spirosoma sp. 48-14]